MTCGCHGERPCGCCAGTSAVTPEPLANRPGLPELRYRVGTHASFLETMTAALARDRRLDRLTTREASDPSLALLDAWATVGDVLTFYQERIANEGYLPTATERRSALELGALVGYRPRPGVSASAVLAYTLEAGARTTIPAGAQVRSVPADGETQQAFETSEPLDADAAWNSLQVRRTRPHTRASILAARAVYLDGLVTSVRVGDPLFIEFAPGDVALGRVVSVDIDAANGRTRIGLEEWAPTGRFPAATASTRALADAVRPLLGIRDFGLTTANATVRAVLPELERVVAALDAGSLPQALAGLARIRAIRDESPPRSVRAERWLDALFAIDIRGRAAGSSAIDPVSVDAIAAQAGLLDAPSRPPRSQHDRADDVVTLFDAEKSEGAGPQVSGAALVTLTSFRPALRESLATAFARATVTAPPRIRVYTAIRTAPFGHAAAPRAITLRAPDVSIEGVGTPAFSTAFDEWPLNTAASTRRQLDLERELDELHDGGIVAIQAGQLSYTVHELAADAVSTVSRSDYGLAGKVTRLVFGENAIPLPDNPTLAEHRKIKVFVAGPLLPLAEQPIADPVCGTDPALELDGFYDGLSPGRWVVLTGERADTTGTAGVQATELLLVGDVQHRAQPDLPGDRLHTFLSLVAPSAYCYRRDTVRVFGNVVKATHGETRKEVLGSGDARVAFAGFALKASPLTLVAAATADGTASTLVVRVNEVAWREAPGLAGLGPDDRRYVTQTNDEGVTTVRFGDGVRGARVPTGTANLRATYRSGIGKAGNLLAGQLSVLGTRPLGVKEVINPLRSSGGADRDSRDQIRVNAPLSVTALDRLVSVRDYEHFARTFAGIGKASATALTDGRRQLVHLTIAGVDDMPIDPGSDLFRNLRRALSLLGDPIQGLQLDVRAARFLVLQAGVKLEPDYAWETTAPRLRTAILEAFAFERRELGQGAFLSEALDALQRVAGVAYVDADRFGAIAEDQLTPSGIAAAIAGLTRAETVSAVLAQSTATGIRPAEIAYFTPDVPATIALNPL